MGGHQPAPGVEQQLAETTGEERLEYLVELMVAHRPEDPPRAVAYGTEALELLASIRDREKELEVPNSLVFAQGRLREYEQGLRFGARSERLARAMGDQAALAFVLSLPVSSREAEKPVVAAPIVRRRRSSPPANLRPPRSRDPPATSRPAS